MGPSRSRETLSEVSPDLTPMLTRLESTLSTMLLMTSDSELPPTTSQLPLSTTLLSQLLPSTLLPLLLTPPRLLKLRLLSAQQLMLVLLLVFSQLPQLPLLLTLLPSLLPLPPVRLSSPLSS